MRKSELVPLMGKRVVVEKVYQRTWGEIRTWEANPPFEIRTGWVVGIRYLQTGKRRYVGYEEGYEWEQTGKPVEALMVCYWPTMKPIPVPLDGFRVATDGDPDPCPSTGAWRDVDREYLRQEMKDWPREKGKWVKKPTA